MRSRPRFAPLLVALAMCAALAACGPAAAPASAPASAAAPTLTTFPIRTAPQVAAACMDALLGGVLVKDARSGLGVRSADGQATAVEWPFGYSAAANGLEIALVDETGTIVAHEGDEINVGGGFGNLFWHACGGVTVVATR
jgi:hypothetical protein